MMMIFPTQTPTIPAITQRDPNRVGAVVQQIDHIVSLNQQTVCITGPARGQQVAADTLPVKYTFIQAQSSDIESCSCDRFFDGEIAAQ